MTESIEGIKAILAATTVTPVLLEKTLLFVGMYECPFLELS